MFNRSQRIDRLTCCAVALCSFFGVAGAAETDPPNDIHGLEEVRNLSKLPHELAKALGWQRSDKDRIADLERESGIPTPRSLDRWFLLGGLSKTYALVAIEERAGYRSSDRIHANGFSLVGTSWVAGGEWVLSSRPHTVLRGIRPRSCPRAQRSTCAPFDTLRKSAFTEAHVASMVTSNVFPLDGGCDCGVVRYRLVKKPLFVHCCHCRWCQRESGASFALNAMIEADYVVHLGAEPQMIDTPSNSGKGQKIARCPKCWVAVWSNYPGAGPVIRFVRVGTLDAPDHLPPDINIFTSSKQPWVQLPAGVPCVAEYYERESHWPPESLARRLLILPKIETYLASLGTG